uniref:DUF3700 domain-containing protein n=1 Tax=Brassica oleracea var. oleracea TaxID=109376 RepID=A0A0D3BUE1_BRAOL
MISDHKAKDVLNHLLLSLLMYHSEIGLKSFEHPKNNIKAMPMIDSEGVIYGANFQVDACTKINAIPKRGTEANWALANTR